MLKLEWNKVQSPSPKQEDNLSTLETLWVSVDVIGTSERNLQHPSSR